MWFFYLIRTAMRNVFVGPVLCDIPDFHKSQLFHTSLLRPLNRRSLAYRLRRGTNLTRYSLRALCYEEKYAF